MKALTSGIRRFVVTLSRIEDAPVAISLSAFCLSLMALLYVKDTYFGFVSFRPFFERLLWIFLIFVPIIVTLYQKKRSFQQISLLLFIPVVASSAVIVPIASRADIFWHEILMGYLGLIFCLAVLMRVQYVVHHLFSKDALRIVGGIFILVLIVFVGGDSFSLILPVGLRSHLVRTSPIYYLEFFQRGLVPASFALYAGLVYVISEIIVKVRSHRRTSAKKISQRKKLAVLGISFIILLGIYVQDKTSLYIDFSGSRGYSVSSLLKDATKEAKRKQTLYVFISSSLPARYVFTRSIIVSLVTQLRSSSLDVVVLDPHADSLARQKAERYQIPSLDLQDSQLQSYTSTTAFFGAALLDGDKVVARIPTLLNLENVHYDLYRAFKSQGATKKRSLQLLGFQDREGDRPNFSGLYRRAEQLFSIIDTPATGSASLEADATLIRVQADTSYAQAIPDFEDYIARGNRLVMLINGVGLLSGEKGLAIKEAKHGLETFLNDYGISMKKSILASQFSEIVPFSTEYGQQLKPYPYALKTNKIQVVPKHTEVVMPWASPLSISGASGISHTVLVTSQKATTEVVGVGTVLPQVYKPENIEQEYILGAEAKIEGNGGSLVVLGSEYMAHDNYVAATPGTYDLLAGVVAGKDAVDLGVGLKHQLWHVQSPRPFTRSDMSMTLCLIGVIVPSGLLVFAYWLGKTEYCMY
ncbi:MAG: ABC-type uncharacterized transport system [Microgenomates bacterium OLB22]|nr:MAG: ABC-type uncharacterized transport system [Microgenomates bacterium OLB22]